MNGGTEMVVTVVGVVGVLYLVLACWAAYVVAASWRETERRGGWWRAVAWAGVVQVAVAFGCAWMVLLALLVSAASGWLGLGGFRALLTVVWPPPFADPAFVGTLLALATVSGALAAVAVVGRWSSLR